MKKILMMMVVVVFVFLLNSNISNSKSIIVRGKITCVESPGSTCKITNPDGTSGPQCDFENYAGVTLNAAPDMNTLSLTEYTLTTNFFIFPAPNSGSGTVTGVIGGRLYQKIGGTCTSDPSYYYIFNNSTTYTDYATWLAALCQ